MRLHHKYHEENPEESAEESGEEEESPHKLLRPSKGYKPEDHEMDTNIMRYKTTVLNEMKIELANKRRPRFNTTKEERRAMKTLKTNKDIVIKPADKGGAIVVMNKQDYIDEGMRQLANKDHYRELENTHQTIKQFIKEVKSTLDTILRKEYISEDLHKILVRTHPRTSNLYLLPKIHKKNNPGRPIINSIGSLTETLSAFIDEILRRYSKLAKSYVKDTSHFLHLTKNLKVKETDQLVTVDVTALYTNIPHIDGIKRVVKFIRNHGATPQEIELCETLLPHILQKNYFQFNDKIYLQISGTAMGTRCAPNYAIIFMAEIEEDFLASQDIIPATWLRFIDDIFMIWNHPKEDLNRFITNLNNFHKTIKFTMESSDYGLPFLDTFIYKEDNTLKTRVYHKPTDNKQYLLYTSCHPKNQKDAIPYGLLVRAKRICTKNEDFISEAKSIIKTLRTRKYPESTLCAAVTRILMIERDTLLNPKNKEEDKRIRYIITFNPSNPPMRNIVEKHIHYLARMKRNPINLQKIQTVYRKASNLRNLLITGLINKKETQSLRCLPCKETGHKGCISCERITPTNTVTSSDNVTLKIRGNFNCQSYNCIYCLTCNCCKKKYVGESSQTVNLRLRGHESHIRYYQKHSNNPVAQHYGINKLTEKEYTVEILDQEEDKNKRNRLEESWIFLLNTMNPYGLNTKW